MTRGSDGGRDSLAYLFAKRVFDLVVSGLDLEIFLRGAWDEVGRECGAGD